MQGFGNHNWAQQRRWEKRKMVFCDDNFKKGRESDRLYETHRVRHYDVLQRCCLQPDDVKHGSEVR